MLLKFFKKFWKNVWRIIVSVSGKMMKGCVNKGEILFFVINKSKY